MADVIDRRPGGGGSSAVNTLYKDEGDGSYPEAVAALARGWNATSGAWERLAIDNASGGLNVNISADGSGLATEATLDAVKTAVELIDNTVSGTELQVDIVAVTPDLMLGTDFSNVFGTAALTDGSNHLQVDIAADSVGIGGGTQYAVDTALGATPTGTLSVAIRDDALSALTPVEGDAIGLRVDSTGALWVATDDTITVDGSGVTQPVSGTVTANLSATDNAVLDSIDAVLDNIYVDTTAILADTANMDTNLGTVAGAVSGTEMQVDIVAVTPDLALGTDISNVFGTGALVAADNATAATQVLHVGGEYNAVLPTYTDGDAALLQMAVDGQLLTNPWGGNANPNVLTDGADNTSNANNQLVTAGMLYGFDGTTWDRLHATAGDLHIHDGGNSITVDGTVTANLSATDNAVLDAIQAAVEIIDNAISGTEMQVDVLTMPTTAVTWNGTAPPIGAGTEAAALRVTLATDSTGVVSIDDNSSTISVDDGAGSLTVDNAALTLFNTQLVAHDAVDAGSPLKIGGKAISLGADPTEVGANDRTDAFFTRAGQQFVIGGHPNIILHNTDITDADGAQTNTLLLSGATGASDRAVVTHIEVTCDAANNAGTQCRIGFGASATPAVDADAVLVNHPGVPPGGGIVKGDGSGILGIGADGDDLFLTCEDPAGGGISITVGYFIISDS